ncbi:unnamed protein product [Gulo gulo]|uniref:Uncharacterized protein n=1 Tax=Gulo gulo TaxID=48420 RepID=A0A9X9LPU5_GULGU|nr:unnamed protein product [Gulo gulo]
MGSFCFSLQILRNQVSSTRTSTALMTKVVTVKATKSGFQAA